MRYVTFLVLNKLIILEEEMTMLKKIRQYSILALFILLNYGSVNTALAESTTVKSSGITFQDGTTQTTAASGSGSSIWSQSGSDIYYNGGNVGIGTDSPTVKLEIDGSFSGGSGGKGLVHLQSDGTESAISLKKTSGGAQHFKIGVGDNSAVGSNWFMIIDETNHGKKRLQIDPSGDVFIGGDAGAGISSNGPLVIKNSGNVGIGTTNPIYPLQMGSGAHVTAAGVWTDASSRDYKENIRDLTYEEAKLALSELTPSKFNYKVDKDDEYLGFIAEDVPDLVATKDRKGLSPMDIVAVLTKVVQQQQAIVERQQEKIENHKEENEALQIKLAEVMGRLEALERN